MTLTKWTIFSCLLLAGACGNSPEPCSDDWMMWVEDAVTTGDNQGHGPDVGSDEWKSVVEFRLGMRGDTAVPRRDSVAWCRYVDRAIKDRR